VEIEVYVLSLIYVGWMYMFTVPIDGQENGLSVVTKKKSDL